MSEGDQEGTMQTTKQIRKALDLPPEQRTKSPAHEKKLRNRTLRLRLRRMHAKLLHVRILIFDIRNLLRAHDAGDIQGFVSCIKKLGVDYDALRLNEHGPGAAIENVKPRRYKRDVIEYFVKNKVAEKSVEKRPEEKVLVSQSFDDLL